jgi:hypothetical protein
MGNDRVGIPWKLSGGSMLSAVVTNVSKKRQVRRAISRNELASAWEITRLPASVGATLTQRATAGANSQARMKGTATGIAALPVRQTNSAASDVMNRLPVIWPAKPIQSVRSMLLDWAAVVQSSRWRRLTKSRYKVRPIASSISQAW